MAHVSALLPEDREWLESDIDDLVGDTSSVRVGEVTDDLIDRLDTQASSGDSDAARVLLALAKDGVRALVSSQIKKQRGTVKLAQTGKVVSVPSRVGSRARDRDGTILRAYQQTLWYELSWEAFEEMVISRLRQITQLTEKVEAFQEVLRYRDQFPDTMTPGEAMERAGIDPESISLDIAA